MIFHLIAVQKVFRFAGQMLQSISGHRHTPQSQDGKPVPKWTAVPRNATAQEAADAQNKNAQSLMAMSERELLAYFTVGRNLNPETIARLETLRPAQIALILKKMLGGAQNHGEARAIARLAERPYDFPNINAALTEHGVIDAALEQLPERWLNHGLRDALEDARPFAFQALADQKRHPPSGDAQASSGHCAPAPKLCKGTPGWEQQLPESHRPSKQTSGDPTLSGMAQRFFCKLDHDGHLSDYINGRLDLSGMDAEDRQIFLTGLQQRLQQWTQFLQTLSTMMKTMGDTSQSIIRNIA